MDQCSLEVESTQTKLIYIFPYEAELFHVAVLKVGFNRLKHHQHKTCNRVGITSWFETAFIVHITRICQFFLYCFYFRGKSFAPRQFTYNLPHGILTCIPRVTERRPEGCISVVVDSEPADFYSSFCTKLLPPTRTSSTYTC